MQKSKKILFSLLLLPFIFLFLISTKTEANPTTIEMDIKEHSLKKIFKTEEKFAQSFNSKFGIDPLDEIKGDVKLSLKFKKQKDSKEQRDVSGKATVKIGNEKFTFPIEEGSLVKSINSEGKEVYFLDADSTFKSKDGNKEVSSLTFAWNKDFSKMEGAISVGTISDFSYITFGNSDKPIRGTTEEERQELADNQQEFDTDEYGEEE